MLEYLENALSERSNDVAYADHAKQEHALLWAKREDSCKTFCSTLSKQQEELYGELGELDIDLQMRERRAVYRAGWLDGIALGVMAASRGKQ